MTTETPYATPDSPLGDVPAVVRRARWALLFAVSPVLALGLTILLSQVLDEGFALGAALAIASLLAALGFFLGGHSAWRILKVGGLSSAGALPALGAVALSFFTAPVGALAALIATYGFTRGRQLRQRGKLVFASIEPDRAGWLDPAQTGATAPDEVAGAWRKNGLTEHASVAAFGKVAAELVSLGAPARLIEAAYQDALDEHRHTALCFSLARDLDGRALAPGPFPAVSALRGGRGPRAVRLANLAVESLVDGALNEGVSARVVAGLVHTAEDPRVQDVLRIIARDEARHAAHGFHVMRWCLEAGGAPVAAALDAALSSLPEQPGGLAFEAEDAEAWGLPSATRLDAEYRAVRTRLLARTRRLLTSAII